MIIFIYSSPFVLLSQQSQERFIAPTVRLINLTNHPLEQTSMLFNAVL